MASEANIVELFGNPKGEPIQFTVADGTGISKGTLLSLNDPRTAKASVGAEIFAGIANADKEASDGATTIGAYTKGVFDIYCDATGVTAGDLVTLSGANLIGTADVNTDAASQANVMGRALQTGAASERIMVKIGGY